MSTTIYQALPLITAAVAPIAKSRTNPQQNYKFRGVDDVYSAINLLLAKHGVTIVPEVLESWHEAFSTAKGSQMFRHRARVKYTLYASDGSHVSATVEGEGMDSGDKATPKALSCAYKYMAFQVFCIPAGEKIDTEEDSPEVVAGNGASHSPEGGRNPTERFEELKQALLHAKTPEQVAAVSARVVEAATAKEITEAHLKLLRAIKATKQAGFEAAA